VRRKLAFLGSNLHIETLRLLGYRMEVADTRQPPAATVTPTQPPATAATASSSPDTSRNAAASSSTA
jgi:hypothetical protein